MTVCVRCEQSLCTEKWPSPAASPRTQSMLSWNYVLQKTNSIDGTADAGVLNYPPAGRPSIDNGAVNIDLGVIAHQPANRITWPLTIHRHNDGLNKSTVNETEYWPVRRQLFH